MSKKNQVPQRQFKGGYIPDQPVDEWDRAYKTEPSSPSKKRNSIQLGSASQARPGLAGMQGVKIKKKDR